MVVKETVKNCRYELYDKDGNCVWGGKELLDQYNQGKRFTFTHWERKSYCLVPVRFRRRPVKILKISLIEKVEELKPDYYL